MFSSRLVFLLFLGLFGVARAATSEFPQPALHVRSGLPTLAAKAHAGGTLRVAYLGGSITAAEGWRPLTTAHLRTLFPRLSVEEIAAALPGTGSDLGACRLSVDVLVHQPDLLFVEFAVNDANTPPAQIERAMEGIVRQTWQASPKTDIWFVYTISKPGLPDLIAGRFPPAAQAMEIVAEHYGIPSLHLGVAVAQRVAAGKLTFQDVAAPESARTFSLDGVHPTPAGHRLYFAALAPALAELLHHESARPQTLPPPLRADAWVGATLRPIADLTRTGTWQPAPPADPNLHGIAANRRTGLWRTGEPEAAIEFEFRGRQLGLYGVAAPDSGLFRVMVDGRPPVTDTLFDAYVSPTFCRLRSWFYPGELTDAVHHVRIELAPERVDKVGIKARAGKPLDDPAPYAADRLTLGAVLLVETKAP